MRLLRWIAACYLLACELIEECNRPTVRYWYSPLRGYSKTIGGVFVEYRRCPNQVGSRIASGMWSSVTLEEYAEAYLVYARRRYLEYRRERINRRRTPTVRQTPKQETW